MNPFNNPLFIGSGSTPPNLPSDSSSSDETDRYVNLFAMAHHAIDQEVFDTASSSRKYTNRDDRIESHNHLVRDYFASELKFDEGFFRQRFRMSRWVFLKIATDLERNFEYFQRKFDARGKLRFSTYQRCTSAIRQLAYGSNPDSLDDYLNMSERSSRDTLNVFCDGVIKLYRHEYLRRPTRNDIQRIFDHHASYHVLDCWIWHAYFGVVGSNNGINVLNQSPLFNYFEDGTTPLIPFTVNGTEYKYPYFLVDEIYPRFAMFVKTIPHLIGEKRIRFDKAQEAARKDVERAFGIIKKNEKYLGNQLDKWKNSPFVGTCMRVLFFTT
uniref:uncharacterized protein LOC122580639 n=1 Tax=Erigeron canadensis TaxID=72917 RepID=UPI001CB91838|nr:uncharacterized protein LOC122580639 [Erigeron canadensis]